jgi:hypothetical protein
MRIKSNVSSTNGEVFLDLHLYHINMKEKTLLRLLEKPWFAISLVLTVLFIITVNHPMFCDEGIWSYIGRIWIENNLPPYKFAVENKNPGIYYLHYISYMFFGVNYMFVRVMGMLSLGVGMYFVRKILIQLHSQTAGSIGIYVYGFVNTWGIFSAYCPGVTENFMCTSVILALWFVVREKPKKKEMMDYILAGLFMGVAVIFKQIAIVPFISLFAFVLLYANEGRFKIVMLKPILLMLISSIFIHFVLLLPVFISGVTFSEYFEGAWLILLNTGTYQRGVQPLYDFFKVWTQSRIVILFIGIPLLMYSKKLLRKPYIIGFLIWIFLDFVSISLVGNLFGHQLKQIYLPLSIIFSIAFAELFDVKENSIVDKKQIYLFLLGLILLFVPYKSIVINGYIKGYYNVNEEVGKWVRDNTSEDESVLLVSSGGAAAVMSYSERISPIKYFNTNFLKEDLEKEELNILLNKNPPDVIVTNDYSIANWGVLNENFMKNYKIEKDISFFHIYFRK